MRLANSIVCTIGCLILLYSFLFDYSFAFNYQAEVNEHYYYLTFSSCIFLLAIAQSMSEMKRNGFSLIRAVVLALIFTTMLLIYAGHFDFSNEYLCCALIGFQLLYVFSVMDDRIARGVVSWSIVAILLLEITIGYLQLVESFHSADRSLMICGSLQNSGIYSIFLVVCLPIFQYCLRGLWQRTTTFNIMLIVIITTVGELIFYAQSRTAIMALCLFLMIMIPKKALFVLHRRRRIVTGSIFIAAISCAALYFLKPASASGRWFIWKTAIMNIVKGNWLTGIGIGRFSVVYPQWQMKTVSAIPSEKAVLLTNVHESFVAFNEYVQLFVEAGFIGLSIILFLIRRLIMFKPFDKRHTAHKQTILLIAVSCLSSYPLHCNAILFLLAFCIAAINEKGLIRPAPVSVAFVACSFSILMGTLFIFRLCNYQENIIRWTTLQNNPGSETPVVVQEYKTLAGSLSANGKFMLDYGEHLLQWGFFKDALPVLEKNKETYTSYRSMLSLASTYYQSGNCTKAMAELQRAAELVPSALTPKYHLANLYREMGQTDRAKAIALLILRTPVKIKNSESFRIKAEMEQLLTN